MPLSKKGKVIKAEMAKRYGSKKGAEVFYASQNRGTIQGTEKKSGGRKRTTTRGNQRVTKR
jgi:hypothetical protein